MVTEQEYKIADEKMVDAINQALKSTEPKSEPAVVDAFKTQPELFTSPPMPVTEFAEMSDIAGLNTLQRDHQTATLNQKIAELEVDLLAHKVEIVRLQFTIKYKMEGKDIIDTKTGLITRNR